MDVVITVEDDRSLRRYALFLHDELGEDAYHDAICRVLERPPSEPIRNITAFCRVAAKRALRNIYRQERTEREQTAAWLAGDPPYTQQALVKGRQPRTECKRGHPMVEENLSYTGTERCCRTCKRMREAEGKKRRKHERLQAA